MHRIVFVSLCAAVAILAVPARAAVSFAKAPEVVKDGANVTISFAVSEATDVAIYIEDANGKVVRHLAAGLLGDTAPAPLTAGKLEQSLAWDRKDDAGKPVPADGKYRVRVAAGLKAAYAGTAFDEKRGPDNLTNVIGLAAGPNGRLYVMTVRWQRAWWTATSIHVFLRNGAYERTIKPMPNSLTPERLEDLRAFRGPNGFLTPVIHRVLAMAFYPFEDVAQHFAVTRDGKVSFVVIPTGYTKAPIQRMASLDADGGLTYDGYTGDILVGNADTGRLNVTAASDDKALYVTGLGAHKAGFNIGAANPPIVYKTTLPERGPLTPFFGDPAKIGNDKEHLNDPRGLAADGKGRLLVADHTNNRVVVMDEKDGKFAGSFDVPSPTWVGVHRSSGAVYVVSKDDLVKFSGSDSPKELARLSLPSVPDRGHRSCALDPEADPAVFWVGYDRGTAILSRTVEKDGKFGPLEPAGFHPSHIFWNVAVGVDNQEVACKVGGQTLRVMNEVTGKWRDLRLQDSGGKTYRLGPNGQIYGQDHAGVGVVRWDKEGKPLPFPATVSNDKLKGALANAPSGTTCWERDFCVDLAGNVYTKHRGPFYHGRKRVDVYDSDGNFKKTAIWVVTDGELGPRVDPAGNIYVAEVIKPLNKPYPDIFKSQGIRPVNLQQYTWMYGSIVKFGPDGGAFWFPKTSKEDGYAFEGEPTLPKGLKKEKFSAIRDGNMLKETGEVEGALWWRYGCSYLLDKHVSHNQRCHCTATEFDVDDFGRTFYPDQGLFQVGVLDTAGNEILRIGGYGNQDSCGPESYVLDPKEKCYRPRRPDDPKDLVSPFAAPDVAIGWTTGLGVSDRYLYIADGLNHRVLRVELSYQAENRVDAP